jgi:hypothetical protein
MKTQHTLVLAAGLLAASSGAALADITHSPPDGPYAAGQGFDKPHEAAWGGWTRGTAGTLYAEWDTWRDNTHGTGSDRTAAPGWSWGSTIATDPPGSDPAAANPAIAPFGVTSQTHLGWNQGTIVVGSGGLYSFTTDPMKFTLKAHHDPSTGAQASGPTTVALQVETWGNTILTPGAIQDNGPYTGPNTLFVNGVAPDSVTQTHTGTINVPAMGGDVSVRQWLALWTLPNSSGLYDVAFDAKVHASLAQVALDVRAVPIPAAFWLFGAALSSLVATHRRRAVIRV